MRSARRAAFAARKNKKESVNYSFLKFVIPVFIIVFFYIFLKINTKVWNGKDKVSVVYKNDGGDIAVTVLDPILSESTTLVIPGDTEVEVSRNYGTFRIKNVWQLGIDEKINGKLLAETVTRNFLFPVFLWTSSSPGLESGKLSEIINFILCPGQTNIPIGDRIYLGLFAMKVPDLGRSIINLGESRFLDKEKLNDGLSGYVISGTMSQRLTAYFSDNELGGNNIKVNITDATGKSGVSEKLGEILQVIGGKVVSIDKRSNSEDYDCIIVGKNSVAVKKISNLFSCKIEKNETTFDLDIKIGKKFAERF